MNYVYQVTVFTDDEEYKGLQGIMQQSCFSHAPQAFAYEMGFNDAVDLMKNHLTHKYWTKVTQEEGS